MTLRLLTLSFINHVYIILLIHVTSKGLSILRVNQTFSFKFPPEKAKIKCNNEGLLLVKYGSGIKQSIIHNV